MLERKLTFATGGLSICFKVCHLLTSLCLSGRQCRPCNLNLPPNPSDIHPPTHHIQELSYSIPDAANKKNMAHLLQGVSGFFEAKQMAALVGGTLAHSLVPAASKCVQALRGPSLMPTLSPVCTYACLQMGPSGSGKTTLLDVLAGRKNAGKVGGAGMMTMLTARCGGSC